MEIPDNVIPSAKLRRRLKYTPTWADEGTNMNPAPKPMPSPWLKKTWKIQYACAQESAKAFEKYDTDHLIILTFFYQRKHENAK